MSRPPNIPNMPPPAILTPFPSRPRFKWHVRRQALMTEALDRIGVKIRPQKAEMEKIVLAGGV